MRTTEKNDAFCYTNADDLIVMYEEFKAKGADIVNGPHFGGWWKEFAIRDLNGYRIAFGGSGQE